MCAALPPGGRAAVCDCDARGEQWLDRGESTASSAPLASARPAEHGYRTTHRASRPAVSLTWMWIAAAAVAVVACARGRRGCVRECGACSSRRDGGRYRGRRHDPLGGDSGAREGACRRRPRSPSRWSTARRRWTVPPADIALSFDYPELAAEAMAVGRNGGFATSVSQRFGAWFGKAAPARGRRRRPREDEARRLTPSPRPPTSPPVTRPSKSTARRRRSSRPPTGSSSSATSSRRPCWRRIPPTTGRSRLRSRRLTPRSATPPPRPPRRLRIKMMADPLTVTYSGKQWTFSPDDIGKMIVFQSVEPTGSAVRSGSKAWTLVPVHHGDTGRRRRLRPSWAPLSARLPGTRGSRHATAPSRSSPPKTASVPTSGCSPRTSPRC